VLAGRELHVPRLAAAFSDHGPANGQLVGSERVAAARVAAGVELERAVGLEHLERQPIVDLDGSDERCGLGSCTT
jgi:hypothetical protein